MMIEDIQSFASEWDRRSRELKERCKEPGFRWYPYSTMASVSLLGRLLRGEYRDLRTFLRGGRVADIGGADGDLAFFLEQYGLTVDLVDNPATNINRLEAAKTIKREIGSKVEIHAMDVDQGQTLPRGRQYDAAFFLGTLYHVKNPFLVMEALARQARYCVLSTRVFRNLPDCSTPLGDVPVAYLVGRKELNDDPTNYWIFSSAGLRQLLHRSGWTICNFMTVGDVRASDPCSADHDERAFAILRAAGLGSHDLVSGVHPCENDWIGPTAKLQMLSGMLGEIVLRGRIPRAHFDLQGRRNHVDVLVEDTPRARVPVRADGSFETRIDVKEHARLEVEVRVHKASRLHASVPGIEPGVMLGAFIDELEAL